MFQRRYARGATLAAVIAVLALLGLSSAPASAAGCDRACLSGLITQYVDALVAQDSSKLPLAKEVRFTEDAKNLTLGEGLWKEKVTKGTFRQDYLDVAKQVAAAHIQLRQGDNNVLLCLLLHVTDGKIAGVETLIERLTPESRFKPTEFVKEIRGMNDPIPAGKMSNHKIKPTTTMANSASPIKPRKSRKDSDGLVKVVCII